MSGKAWIAKDERTSNESQTSTAEIYTKMGRWLIVATWLLVLSLVIYSFLDLMKPTAKASLPLFDRAYPAADISPGGANVILLASTDSLNEVLKSVDGGVTWKVVMTDTFRLSVLKIDWQSGIGFVCGSSGPGGSSSVGRFYRTSDFGESWHAISGLERLLPFGVSYDGRRDRGAIFAIYRNTLMLARAFTVDSGKTWALVPSGNTGRPIPAATPREGSFEMDLATGAGHYLGMSRYSGTASIYYTQDGGVSWSTRNAPGDSSRREEQTTKKQMPLVGLSSGLGNVRSATFDSQNKIGLAISIGTGLMNPDRMFKTLDGGMTWQRRFDAPPGRDLIDIQMDWGRGYGILLAKDFGANTRVYVTRNQGDFFDGPAGMIPSESSFCVMDWSSGQGFALADTSVRLKPASLFKTTDKGLTWKKIVPYRVTKPGALPYEIAQYILLAIMVSSLGVIVLAMYSRRKIWKAATKDIARKLDALGIRTDNPSDRDTLNFKSTVAAVVSLLENIDTRPPLSVVVSGEWGSGKSSFMKQILHLIADQKRFIPVWFNAWHYQSEEHLLTGFMTSIMHHLELNYGPKYRYKLFRNRLKRMTFLSKFRFWFAILFLLPIVLYGVGNLAPWHLIQEARLRGISMPGQLFERIDSLVSIFQSGGKIVPPAVAAILGLVSLFFLKKDFFSSGLSAFVELLPMQQFKMQMTTIDPGFRERYKKEFWEILGAADSDTRLVVFIDDLDRIDGQRVKQLLEAINFVADTASSPADSSINNAKIFFVIGMYVEEVIRSLDEILGRPNTSADPANVQTVGARYIEKLVDLVVRVPSLEGCNSQTLMTLTGRENENQTETNLAQ
jgi:hypothetical protein